MRVRLKNRKRRKPPKGKVEILEKKAFLRSSERSKTFSNVNVYRNINAMRKFPLDMLKFIFPFLSSSRIIFSMILSNSKVKYLVDVKFAKYCYNVSFVISKSQKEHVCSRKKRYVHLLIVSYCRHYVYLHCFPSLKYLIVKEAENYVRYDEALLPTLKEIRLDRVSDLSKIRSMGGLERLELHFCLERFPEGDFFEPSRASLKHLVLDTCNEEEELNLSNFPSLISLTCLSCPKVFFGMDLPLLEELTLRNCESVTNEMFIELPNLRKLETMTCPNLSDEAYTKVSSILEELVIRYNSKVTEDVFRHGGWEGLKKITLKKCPLISGEYLYKLRSSLEFLEIEECPRIMDIHLRNLQRLRKLRIVKCSNIQDERSLRRLREIRELSIWGNKHITDLVFDYFPVLEKLEVGGCKNITGSGLGSISTLKRLGFFHQKELISDVLFEDIGTSETPSIAEKKTDNSEEEFNNLFKDEKDEEKEEEVDEPNNDFEQKRLFKNLEYFEACFCPKLSGNDVKNHFTKMKGLKLKEVLDCKYYEIHRVNVYSKKMEEFVPDEELYYKPWKVDKTVKDESEKAIQYHMKNFCL